MSVVTAADVLRELEEMGSASYKQILMKNHGVREPCFGVKIGDLKKIQKRIKKDYHLALDLYGSGNYDAMYLAGLIADDARMTEEDLQVWAEGAYAGALPGYTVAWVAAGSEHGWRMGLKWIESDVTNVSVAGWSTLASVVALKDDSELDLEMLRELMARVSRTIRDVPDPVQYAMNNFLIGVGCYVRPLTEVAIETAEGIGNLSLELGDNACKVPGAADYIRKVEGAGKIGKKRRSVKC